MRLQLKVVRRPNTDAIHKILVDAIAKTYDGIGKTTERSLREPVDNWRVGPSFYYKVDVDEKRWKFSMFHRSQTDGGARYDWVRKGTGLYGPKGSKYPIRPVKASVLRFRVPSRPKTFAPGQTPTTAGPGGIIFTGEVNHPGIKPRNKTKGFPAWVYKTRFKDKSNIAGFFQRTKRAGKAALRSIK